MKRLIKILATIFICMTASSCDELGGIIDNTGNEIDGLTETIQKIQDALDNGDTIISVSEVEEGYELTFASGTTITIKCEKDDVTISKTSITINLGEYQNVVFPITPAPPAPLDITFDLGAETVYADITKLKIAYVITGGTENNQVTVALEGTAEVEITGQDKGIITIIETVTPDFDIKVTVTDGESQSISKTLRFIFGWVAVPESRFEVHETGGQIQVPILTNIDYEVIIENDWISIAPETKAYEPREETLVFNVAENPDVNDRTGIVHISYGGTLTEVTIEQRGNGPHDGFASGTWTQMFNIDPNDDLYHLPHYHTPAFATLAYLDGYLVINHHDIVSNGTVYTPIYIDGTTGRFKGKLDLGGMNFGAITNDEGGNMLLCNYLDGNGGTLDIYRTKSINEAPELFYSYDITLSLPVGHKIKVCGNIDDEATIVIPFSGIDGICESGQFINIIIKAGSVVSAEVIDVHTTAGIAWKSAPTNNADVVAASPAENEGWFYGEYDDIHGLQYILPYLGSGNQLPNTCIDESGTDMSWGLRPGTLDSKQFNNVTYMAHFVMSHFPGWGSYPSLWVYDISQPDEVYGTCQESSSLIASDDYIEHHNMNNAQNGTVSCGDVVIGQSADGSAIYIYCYDHYANVLCGYTAVN